MTVLDIGKRLRHRGLVTFYRDGGLQDSSRGGGACEVLPLRKEGVEKALAMLKGGGRGTKSFGAVFM